MKLQAYRFYRNMKENLTKTCIGYDSRSSFVCSTLCFSSLIIIIIIITIIIMRIYFAATILPPIEMYIN
jgi:hypothetical protein